MTTSAVTAAAANLGDRVPPMRPSRLLTALAALLLLLPATAAAQGGNSLPGDGSALDQYVESIPDGKGGRPSTDAGGDAGGSSSAAPIGGGLETLGSDGEAAAQLAAVTAPDAGGAGESSGVGSGGGSDGAGEGGSDRSEVPGFTVGDPGDPGLGGGLGSPGETIATLLGDDGSEGLGVVLPLILLAILVVALGTAALRSRRTGRGEKTP